MTIARSLKLAASAFAAVLTLATALPAAHAQATVGQSSKVNVPFSFEIGSRHFAPGTYTLNLQGDHMLAIKGETNAAILMVNPGYTLSGAARGKAVFEQIGDKHFLTQVWTADSTLHLECVKTHEQAQAEKNQQIALRAQPTAPATTQPALVALNTIR